MSSNDSHYPEFVPNQILTNKQLNDLRIYLAEQDRRSRIRLTGTGIVYGLSWTVKSEVDGPWQIVIDEGFGITSEGYLIELEKTTYTHYQVYKDPDVDEDKKPLYEPWQDGGVSELRIWELLKPDALPADPVPKPLPENLGRPRVLVLYLEKEPVDLKSCLVTDCSNKGRNIRFNVRALLVDKKRLENLALAPDLLVRIPRLTGLEDVTSVGQLREAYAAIVGGAALQLKEELGQTFKNYAEILDLDSSDFQKIRYFLRGMSDAAAEPDTFRHFQYRYDVLKDLACAHREFVVAAAERIASRRPIKDFGRHLMLGGVGRLKGYRHEFMPSPAVGDLERVRKLFERIVAMVRAVDYPDTTEVRITPSHTEAHALGKRAVPYYYGLTPRIKDRWQPKLSRTAEQLWSYHNLDETTGTSDLDFDYNRCSFLRIEGYRSMPCGDALREITEWRNTRNVEFEVLCSYLEDPNPDDLSLDEYRSALATGLQTLRDHLAEFATSDEVDFNWELASRGSGGLIGLDEDVLDAYAEWIDFRFRRKLHCDLQDGYLATRNAVLCALHQLLGELERTAELVELTPDGEEWAVRAQLKNGVLRTAIDRLAVRITALRTESEQEHKTALNPLLQNLSKASLWVAWRASVDALRDGVAALLEDRFPKDLRAFSDSLFLDKYRAIVTGVVHLGLLAHLGRVAGPGGVSVLPPELGEIAAGLSNWAGTCCHSRLAALYSAYEHRRRTDPSLFANLVGSVDGLEHLAGVEKGGTFVLVCEERPQQGADPEFLALADFSLAGRVPCCCEAEPAEICLPPMALPDSRIVILEIDDSGDYTPVNLEIPVLVNDFDPNFDPASGGDPNDLEVQVPTGPWTSQLGAVLTVDENKSLVHYGFESPVPGAIDRFSYTLVSNHATCPGAATGEVLVLLIPEPEDGSETWTIRGTVKEDDVSQDGEMVQLWIGNAKREERTTDIDGKYNFSNLGSGVYTVKVRYKSETRTLGDQDLVIDFLFSSETTELLEISGVVYGIEKGASRDDEEVIMSGVAVELRIDDEPRSMIPTNEWGRYSFLPLRPGQYTVFVQGKTQDGTVNQDTPHLVFDFHLGDAWYNTGKVEVWVKDQRTNNLLSGATVTLDPADEHFEATAVPSAQSVEFSDVTARIEYTVTATKTGYRDRSSNPFFLAAGETKTITISLSKDSRVSVSDELIAIVAAHRKLSSAAAQAKVEEVCGARHGSRLATLAEIGEDAALRRSVAYQSGERFLTETLADAGLGDNGVIAAFEEFSERLVKTIRSAAAERKPPYRTLFRSVSLGLMDWLVLNHPETLSPESKAALTEMVRNLRQARAGLEKLRQGWDGAALARELGVTTVDDVHEALR